MKNFFYCLMLIASTALVGCGSSNDPVEQTAGNAVVTGPGGAPVAMPVQSPTTCVNGICNMQTPPGVVMNNQSYWNWNSTPTCAAGTYVWNNTCAYQCPSGYNFTQGVGAYGYYCQYQSQQSFNQNMGHWRVVNNGSGSYLCYAWFNYQTQLYYDACYLNMNGYIYNSYGSIPSSYIYFH